jgi:hypothetical protein
MQLREILGFLRSTQRNWSRRLADWAWAGVYALLAAWAFLAFGSLAVEASSENVAQAGAWAVAAGAVSAFLCCGVWDRLRR